MSTPPERESVVVAVRGAGLVAESLRALLVAHGWELCDDGRRTPTVEVCEVSSLPYGATLPAAPGGIPILAVDEDADPDRLVQAIEAGATGYTTTLVEPSEFLEALGTVATGQASIPPELLGGMLRTLIERRRTADLVRDQLRDLTARERQTLGAIIAGLTVEEMAERSFVAPSTARTHVQGVLRKLGVHSQVEAAARVRAHLDPAELDELIADLGSAS